MFSRGTAPPLPLAGLALLLVLGCAEAPPPATGEELEEKLESAIVEDSYLLRVRLPPTYDPASSYPLVVQLDPTFAGLQQYAITVGLISANGASGRWEEAIVVGVDYDDPSLRQRDYLPPDPAAPDFEGEGADLFYRVLKEEVLPTIEADYSVDPTRRYLLGHSNGGIFAWYAALRHDPADPTDPDPLFAGIVAADNGYPEGLFTYERWHDERAEDLPITLLATRATFNGAVQKITFEALVERLQDRDYPGLTLETRVLETDHGGAVLPSYEEGLELFLGGSR